MMKRLAALFVLWPSLACAGTYWVSPTGAATWANCQSATPLADTAACPLSLASANPVAGDTVYFRGGTYLYDVNYNYALAPTHSGTSGAKITFSAYASEVPIIQQANLTNPSFGMAILGVNYLRVLGLTFKNFQFMALEINGGSYNEIAYCQFINEGAYQAADRAVVIGMEGAAPWSTHNWFHHNYLSGRHNTSTCQEGIDLLRIGMGESNPYAQGDNNTVENNYFEYSGHGDIVTMSKHNVIRNNVAHNEPWESGCTAYYGAMQWMYGDGTWWTVGSTSTTSLTIGTGSRTLTVATGLPADYWPGSPAVSIVSTADPTQVMWGMMTSYTTATGALAVTIYKSAGSGTYSSWYVSARNTPFYTNTAFNGLYGHRVSTFGDADNINPNYNLVEGNRFGWAGTNPNNGGADALDVESPYNIVRYNFVYASMASGIAFKGANSTNQTGGVHNWVYNNTSYHNGHGWDATLYGGMNLAYNGQGFAQNSTGGGATYNRIKNNLAYDNGYGDICDNGLGAATCAPANYDTVVNNWTTYSVGQKGYGDPKFTNPALTDPTSATLPDLTLQASSPVIDQGAALTTATGSGSDSTTLVVGDAGYFQDGTWGSSLSSVQADWIAIGTVTNAVRISSINYATNTITLASATSWSNGASVWLYRKSDGTRVLYGAAPDLGAYEYGMTTPAAPGAPTVKK